MLGLIVSVVVLAGLIVFVLRDQEEFSFFKPLLLIVAVGFTMLVTTAVLTPVVGEVGAALISLPVVAALLVFLLMRFCAATLGQAALITGLFFAFQVVWSFVWLFLAAPVSR